MIRINLLPVRQVKKVQAGQRQLALFLGLLAVELVALVLLHNATAAQIDDKRREVSKLETEIAALKQEVGDYERLQAQRAVLIKQRDVINQLNQSRVGPVWPLRELASLVSVSGRPTLDDREYEDLLRRNPSAGFNMKWNPRRLWVESVREAGGSMTLAGKAKDFDDVAEFLKRLTASKYFDDIQLRRNDAVQDAALGIRVVRFSLTAKMLYQIKTEASAPPPAAGGGAGAPPQQAPGAKALQRAITGPKIP